MRFDISAPVNIGVIIAFKIPSCRKLVIRLHLPAEAIPYNRQVTWTSAAAGTIDHGWQETALLRGPGAIPRRSDDRRALAAVYDVVADVPARPLWNEWKSVPGSSGPCSDGSCRRGRNKPWVERLPVSLPTILKG